MLIDLDHLPIPTLPDRKTYISTKPLATDLLAQMEMPLGFLLYDPRKVRRESFRHNDEAGSSLATNENSLVFLDREFWVCTWAFNNSDRGSRVRRHFSCRAIGLT